MPSNLELLYRFCVPQGDDTGRYPGMRHPFVIDGKTCATNGRAIVVLPQVVKDIAEFDQAKMPKLAGIQSVIKCITVAPTKPIAIGSYPAPLWEKEFCTYCDARGQWEESFCEDCGGVGFYMIPCETNRVMFDDGVKKGKFDLQYLYLLHGMKGLSFKITTDGTYPMMAIWFDGGMAGIMGVNDGGVR